MKEDPNGISFPFMLSSVLFEDQDTIDVFVVREKFVGGLGGQQGDGAVGKSFPYGSNVSCGMKYIPQGGMLNNEDIQDDQSPGFLLEKRKEWPG